MKLPGDVAGTLHLHVLERNSPLPDDVLAELTRLTAVESMIGLTEEVIDSHEVKFLLLDDGRLAAYGAITGRCELVDPGGDVLRLAELGGDFVAHEFRNRGLARALVEWRVAHLATTSRDLSADGAVAFTNRISRHYYEHAGFVPMSPGQTLRSAFTLCKRCNICVRENLTPWVNHADCCDFDGIRVLDLAARRQTGTVGLTTVPESAIAEQPIS